MNPLIKNILAIVLGIIIGSAVNMALIMLGHTIIPPPAGFDPMDMDSLVANMHLFENKHFVFPFLAHALGTLVGAAAAVKVSTNGQMSFALAIAVFFLAGGIYNAFALPGPGWFNALDLVLAYIPMGWLGYKIIQRK